MKVQFTLDAKEDVAALKAYTIQRKSKQAWKTIADEIKCAVGMIKLYPHSGTVVQDLADLGITGFRQYLTAKERLIYEVDVAKKLISIHLVCGQSQNLPPLLMRRLLSLRSQKHTPPDIPPTDIA